MVKLLVCIVLFFLLFSDISKKKKKLQSGLKFFKRKFKKSST